MKRYTKTEIATATLGVVMVFFGGWIILSGSELNIYSPGQSGVGVSMSVRFGDSRGRIPADYSWIIGLLSFIFGGFIIWLALFAGRSRRE